MNCTRNIKESFNKEHINTLPQEVFSGKIVVIQSKDEADKAVDFLLRQSVLGIDTETRPSFKKGVSHKVALLQISTEDICFLFRINYTGITESIKTLLESEKVMKVGLSLKDDIRQLTMKRNFTPGSFLDLQHVVKEMGIKDMSLQKIYANLFGKRISKGQQLSNWEIDVLTDAQKKYASTDAWACLKIYNELEWLKANNNYILIS